MCVCGSVLERGAKKRQNQKATLAVCEGGSGVRELQVH